MTTPSPLRRSVRVTSLVTSALATAAVFSTAPAQSAPAPHSLRVLQMNTWLSGTAVKDGEKLLTGEIQRHDPDVVILSEAGAATQNLATDLNHNGGTYYQTPQGKDTGIISKYPIESSEEMSNGFSTKAILKVGDARIAVYSLHLNDQAYATFLPRGYNAASSKYPGWDEIASGPVTNVKEVLAVNTESGRPAVISDIINDAAAESKKGRHILLGGDFNEPSALDWTAATKGTFDHNGTVILWQSTRLLTQAGFADAYRTKYPNPLTHPGITWSAGNPLAPVSKLDWSPHADGRDRIDFLFTKSGQALRLNNIGLIGPNTSVSHGKIVADNTQDNFLDSSSPFASDHRHLLANFTLNPQ